MNYNYTNKYVSIFQTTYCPWGKDPFRMPENYFLFFCRDSAVFFRRYEQMLKTHYKIGIEFPLAFPGLFKINFLRGGGDPDHLP